ncbi:MAG: sensor histidine kinase [Pseudomonadota bacterium]
MAHTTGNSGTEPKRRRRGGYSLRGAVIAFLVLPLVMLGATGGWYGLTLLEREAGERMEEELELIARSLQAPVSRALRLEREGAVNEALESAFGFARVYGAYVYGPEGERIATSGPEAGRIGSGKVSRIAEEGEEKGRHEEQEGRELYSYFVPLLDSGGRIIGLLQVTRRGSDFDRYVEKIRRQGWLVLVSVALIMIGVVFTGHHYAVGRHFQGMRRRLAALGQGRRDARVEPSGPSEMRELATDLNAMLDRIEESEQALLEQRGKEKALEERLRQSEKMAAIGQLAAGVAHELGSPMAVIAGKAQRAQRQTEEPEIGKALTDIREQVARMERTVSQLIDFGRGHSSVRRREPVARVIQAAIQQVEDEAHSEGVAIEVAGREPSPELEIERLRLEQALTNLVRNAVQATPGGRVRVSWEEEGEETHLVVEDDGPGIDEELRNRLFEPFFTTKPVGSGTGLGLAVTQGAVSEHGGHIVVERSPELGGCRFVITIPKPRGGHEP